MKSNYKRLGDYIKPVKEKNIDLKASKLLGINIDKFFMPSVANVIGTDMSNYKIVKKGQFACNRMHVGRDYRIPIALSKEEIPFMVSPAYDVFEIIDTDVLLPEYLMMWFSRKEFDRNTWFHTDADVRGGLPWSAFCDLELPIPSLEKQQEIVREYNTIQNRIALNNQLINKLEETAQTIYKEWFVDFEFPDENGKPYKGNGGKMVWCAELEKEIPEGWSVNFINEYIKLSQGLAMNASNQHLVVEKGIPLLRITDLINRTEEIFISEKVDKNVVAVKEDIIVSRTGQVGLVFRNKIGVVYNNCFKVNPYPNLNREVLYWFLKTKKMYSIMNELASGSSAQLDLTHKQFYTLKFLLPTYSLQLKFSEKSIWISKHLEICELQVQKLEELKDLLLAKMTRVES
jgi:type I restriction enzyme, S subunit